MARRSGRLPTRIPVGSVYVVEAHGSVQGMALIHRYVRFPDGRKVELTARLVSSAPGSRAINVKTPRMPPTSVRARAASADCAS